jgi:hypothetical protein
MKGAFAEVRFRLLPAEQHDVFMTSTLQLRQEVAGKGLDATVSREVEDVEDLHELRRALRSRRS